MTRENGSEEATKESGIVIKKGNEVNIGLADYRAFLSFSLLGIAAYFAYVGNEAWREFALMAGMALAWWFKRA